MAVNDLALSWKDHHGVLISVFEKLLEKKSLVDCTLAAEGKFLKAHKIVLSACSPYLEALLNQENDKHPIIFLRDVQFEDLKTLVEFVYSGEIRIPEDRLLEFLSVAEALQIKGLGGTDNEGSLKKPMSVPKPQPARRENCSPVPRKRARQHSNDKEDECPRERESSPDVSVIEPSPPLSLPPPPPPPPSSHPVPSELVARHSNETPLHVSNFGSVPTPSTSLNSSSSQKAPPALSTVLGDILPDIRKVKEEVVNTLTGVSVSVRSVPERGPSDSSSEEILGLKPEFEHVTFTEDYSDDMLPEDDNSEEPVMDQSQPSSSQHNFSGFTGAPVDTRGMDVGAQFMEEREEQPASEGPAGGEPAALNCLSGAECPAWRESRTEVHACLVCRRVFTEEAALARHTLAHSKERPHACSTCSLRFAHWKSLAQHMVTHSGERPHVCATCGARFARADTLSQHVFVHTGERPHRCHVCNCAFAQLSTLRNHMATHANTPQHRCIHCNKVYRQLRILRSHLRTCHP